MPYHWMLERNHHLEDKTGVHIGDVKSVNELIKNFHHYMDSRTLNIVNKLS